MTFAAVSCSCPFSKEGIWSEDGYMNKYMKREKKCSDQQESCKNERLGAVLSNTRYI